MGPATWFSSTKGRCSPCRSIRTSWRCAAPPRRYWRRLPTALGSAPPNSIFREADRWVYEARRDTMTRLTFGGAAILVPVWSPDGRHIVLLGPGGMWWIGSGG